MRHQKMAGKAVGDPLAVQSTGSRATYFVGLAEKDPAAVVVLVAEFVPNREALPSASGTGIYGDNGLVGRSDDPSFTCVEGAISHLRAQMPRYRFHIDFARVGNA
jgi:hypothetical protein